MVGFCAVDACPTGTGHLLLWVTVGEVLGCLIGPLWTVFFGGKTPLKTDGVLL